IFRVEHVDQTKPIPTSSSVLVHVDQLIKIIAKTKTNSQLPCRFIAFQHKASQQARRTVLDGQCIRQTEVVLGNDIRIDQRHRNTPGEGRYSTNTAAEVLRWCEKERLATSRQQQETSPVGTSFEYQSIVSHDGVCKS